MLNQSSLLRLSFLRGKWAGKSHRIGEIYDEMFGTLIVIFLSLPRFAQSSDKQQQNKTLQFLFSLPRQMLNYRYYCNTMLTKHG